MTKGRIYKHLLEKPGHYSILNNGSFNRRDITNVVINSHKRHNRNSNQMGHLTQHETNMTKLKAMYLLNSIKTLFVFNDKL